MSERIGNLRIDVYLKLTGIFKTRSEAGRACRAGYVRCGDSEAKSSREVSAGDMLTVTRPDGSVISLEITRVPETRQVSRKSRTEYYRPVDTAT